MTDGDDRLLAISKDILDKIPRDLSAVKAEMAGVVKRIREQNESSDDMKVLIGYCQLVQTQASVRPLLKDTNMEIIYAVVNRQLDRPAFMSFAVACAVDDQEVMTKKFDEANKVWRRLAERIGKLRDFRAQVNRRSVVRIDKATNRTNSVAFGDQTWKCFRTGEVVWVNNGNLGDNSWAVARVCGDQLETKARERIFVAYEPGKEPLVLWDYEYGGLVYVGFLDGSYGMIVCIDPQYRPATDEVLGQQGGPVK